MTSKKPSRGVLDGIRNDAKRAKETGETYNPNGTGVAWSHNFLNQKPWHPLNFRNQKAKFEAEERAYRDAKANQIAQREFEEEQARLHNTSFLNEADRQRYSELQSVSFMYTKPPGMDAALKREKAEENAGSAATGGGSGDQKDPQQDDQQRRNQQRQQRPVVIPKIDAAALLSAKEALASQSRLHLKQGGGAGYRSPTHGGFDASAENQQYLVGGSSEEELDEPAAPSVASPAAPPVLLPGSGSGVESELDAMFATLKGPEGLESLVAELPDKQRRRILRAYAEWTVGYEERQRSAAKAFLKSAGYKSSKTSKKEKKEKKEKHKKHRSKKAKKSRREDVDRRPDESSSGDDAADGLGRRGSPASKRFCSQY